MKKASLILALIFLTSSVSTTYIGNDELVDSIPYPSGGAVDILRGQTYYEFVVILPSGEVYKPRESIIINCDEMTVLIRATNNWIHLVTEGDCGVNHTRYKVPIELGALRQPYYYYMPVKVGD